MKPQITLELTEVNEFGLKYLLPTNETAKELFKLLEKKFLRATKTQALQELFDIVIVNNELLIRGRK